MRIVGEMMRVISDATLGLREVTPAVEQRIAQAMVNAGFVHPDFPSLREGVEMGGLQEHLIDLGVNDPVERAKALWALGWRAPKQEAVDPRTAVWKELLADSAVDDEDDITEAVLVLRTRNFAANATSVCIGRTRGTDYVLMLGLLHAAVQIETQGAWVKEGGEDS